MAVPIAFVPFDSSSQLAPFLKETLSAWRMKAGSQLFR